MIDKAILVDGKIVPCDDLFEWGKWFETSKDRFIARTIINWRKKIWVSTVFLGLNHSFMRFLGGEEMPGIWFETMIFGTSLDGHQRRYSTIEAARRGHAEMVGRARQARQLPGSSKKSYRRTTKNIKKFLYNRPPPL